MGLWGGQLSRLARTAAPGNAIRVLALIGAVALASALSFACDEVRAFTVVNETESPVLVELSLERPEGSRALDLVPYTIQPGESDSDSGGIFFPGSSLNIRATSGGRIILQASFTYDELKDMGFQINIQSGGPQRR